MFSTRTLGTFDFPNVYSDIAAAFFSGGLDVIAAHFDLFANGVSTMLLGYEDSRLVGIVTVRWDVRYPPFRERGIPLIQYLEIRYEDQGQGYGSKMLAAAE